MTTTETVKLAACPWHGTADDLDFDDNGAGTVWVVCNRQGCGCEGPYAASREEAAAKWNCRDPAGGEVEPVASLRKLKLWFFRDLTDDQRKKLFSLHGLPVNELTSLSYQQLAFNNLVATPAPSGEAVPVAWRYRVSPNQINWNYWGDSERPIGRPSGVDIVIAEPLYAAPPQGVEITEAMVQVGRRAILKCRFYDPEPHMYDSEAAFFAHIETTDHWPEAEDEARNALTAALSPTGRDPE